MSSNSTNKGLQHICYSCGAYGYSRDTCPKSPSTPEAVVDSSGLKSCSETSTHPSSKVENLYGPWMVVENRSSPNASTIDDANVDNLMDIVMEVFDVIQFIDPSSKPHRPIIKNDAYMASNSGKKSRAALGVIGNANVVPMVTVQKVNVFKHDGCVSGDHSTVVILKKGHWNSGVLRTAIPKARAVLVKGSKDNNCWGLKIRKNSDSKWANHPTTREWAHNVSSQISAIAEQPISEVGGNVVRT
ncbi:hypothetical protein V6N13_124005 [Hibiscus sabdariffa]